MTEHDATLWLAFRVCRESAVSSGVAPGIWWNRAYQQHEYPVRAHCADLLRNDHVDLADSACNV